MIRSQTFINSHYYVAVSNKCIFNFYMFAYTLTYIADLSLNGDQLRVYALAEIEACMIQ